MSNYKGYYIKIGDCTFNNPSIKREGFTLMPHLVQTADSGVNADGSLTIKELPHRRTKMTIQFPIMTIDQFKIYYAALNNMYLSVEYYNETIDTYETGTFYHSDLQYKPEKYLGQEMIDFQQFDLIEH